MDGARRSGVISLRQAGASKVRCVPPNLAHRSSFGPIMASCRSVVQFGRRQPLHSEGSYANGLALQLPRLRLPLLLQIRDGAICMVQLTF